MEFIKKIGNILIIVCIILELLIWPSLNNLVGCFMTLIAWIIFSQIGLNTKVIKEHTFAWLVFLSMSLYRILPLIATMLEGHSIGYNFVLPLSTYCGETILYLISSFAFYLAINYKNPLSLIKRLLYHCGFYDCVSSKTLWAIGIVGLIFKIFVTINTIEYGNVLGKTMEGFTFFQYAPILLFFPVLINNTDSNKIFKFNKMGLLYLILLIIVSFATNSRQAMIEPIGTFALLFILAYVNSSKLSRHNIKKIYIVYLILIALLLIPIINNISLAMLYNRKFRADISRTELFQKTIKTYQDKEQMGLLQSIKEKTIAKDINASIEDSKTWTETYVSNFALNRYCNLKVTDNTLYHAKKVGFANEYMFNDFWIEIAALLPSPFLKFLNINYDKSVRYSRGDKLKALSLNRHPISSYLITSHLADGLLTFGFWYFPIEFILFFIRFLFLDTFLIRYNGKVHYSIFGLITIFSFLAMFRHAGGCCDSLFYILRGYWQNIILFIFGFTLLRKLTIKL